MRPRKKFVDRKKNEIIAEVDTAINVGQLRITQSQKTKIIKVLKECKMTGEDLECVDSAACFEFLTNKVPGLGIKAARIRKKMYKSIISKKERDKHEVKIEKNDPEEFYISVIVKRKKKIKVHKSDTISVVYDKVNEKTTLRGKNAYEYFFGPNSIDLNDTIRDLKITIETEMQIRFITKVHGGTGEKILFKVLVCDKEIHPKKSVIMPLSYTGLHMFDIVKKNFVEATGTHFGQLNLAFFNKNGAFLSRSKRLEDLVKEGLLVYGNNVINVLRKKVGVDDNENKKGLVEEKIDNEVKIHEDVDNLDKLKELDDLGIEQFITQMLMSDIQRKFDAQKVTGKQLLSCNKWQDLVTKFHLIKENAKKYFIYLQEQRSLDLAQKTMPEEDFKLFFKKHLNSKMKRVTYQLWDAELVENFADNLLSKLESGDDKKTVLDTIYLEKIHGGIFEDLKNSSELYKLLFGSKGAASALNGQKFCAIFLANLENYNHKNSIIKYAEIDDTDADFFDVPEKMKNKQRFLRLSDEVKQVIAPDCLIGSENYEITDDIEFMRTSMKGCNCAFMAKTLCDWLLHNFQKSYESDQIHCPMACKDKKGKLIVWNFEELIQKADFNQQEKKILRLERDKRLAVRVKHCPDCKHDHDKNVVGKGYAIKCKNIKCKALWCWWCQQIWQDIDNKYICGNENCEKVLSVKQIIDNSPTGDVDIHIQDGKNQYNGAKNVPYIRACEKCLEICSYVKGCKKMVCSYCQHKFCFICLIDMQNYDHRYDGSVCQVKKQFQDILF